MGSIVKAVTKPFFGDPEGAAEDAAAAQARRGEVGVAEQRRQFDIGQEQLRPFREAELQALGQRQALLGLSGAEAQQAAIESIQTSPGQAFMRERQEQALLRNTAATGGLGGARVQEALQQQAAGFAQSDLQNQLQRLQGIGTGATTGTVNLGQNFGSQFARGQQGIGQAQASGILGAQQGRAGVGGQLLGLGIGAASGGLFSPWSKTPGVWG